MLINAGFLLTWLGLYDEARASYESVNASSAPSTIGEAQVISLLNVGMVEVYQSHPAQAREAAERAVELARRMESQPMVAGALANLGAAERDLGETRLAIEHVQEGLALRRSLGQRAETANDVSDLAIAYLDDGRVAEARAACAEMLRLLEEAPSSVMHPQYVLRSAAQTSWAEGTKRKRGVF